MNPLRVLTFIAVALLAASAPLAQARPDGLLRTEETAENTKAIIEQTSQPEERIVTIMAVPMVPNGNTSTEPTTTSTEALEATVTLAAPPPLQNSSNDKVSVAYPSEETTAKLDLGATSSTRPLEIHDFSAAPEVKLGEGHHSYDESLVLRNKESQNVQEDPKAPSVLVAEEKMVSSTLSSNQASTVGTIESEPVTPLDELTNFEGNQGPLIIRPTVESTVEPILVPVQIPLVCPSCGRMSLHHPGEEPCACQHCGCDMSDQHGGVTSHAFAGMSGMPEFYRMGNAGHQQQTQTAASPFQVYQRGNALQMQGAFQNPSGQEEVRMVPLKADFDFRTKNLLKLRTDVDNLRSYKEAIGVPKGQLKLVANYKYSDDVQGTGKLPVPPAIPMAPVMYTMQLPNLPSQHHQSMGRPTERPLLDGSTGNEQQSKWKWSFSFPSWLWGGTSTEEPLVEVEQEPLPKPMQVQQKPAQIQPQVPQGAQTQVKPPRAPQQFQIPIQTRPPVVQPPLQPAPVKQPQAVQMPEKKPQVQQQQQQASTRPEQRPQVQQQQVHQQTIPEQPPQFQQQQYQVPQQQTLKVPEKQQQQRPEQLQQVPQQPQRPEQLQQVPQQQQRPQQPQQVPQQPQQPPKQPEQRPQVQQQHQSPQPLPPQQPLKTPEPPQQVPQQRPIIQQQSQAFQPQQQQPLKAPEFSMQQQPNLALPAGGSATPVQVVPQQRLPQRTYYRAREAGDVVVGPPYRAYDPEVIATLRLLNDPYEQLQN